MDQVPLPDRPVRRDDAGLHRDGSAAGAAQPRGEVRAQDDLVLVPALLPRRHLLRRVHRPHDHREPDRMLLRARRPARDQHGDRGSDEPGVAVHADDHERHPVRLHHPRDASLGRAHHDRRRLPPYVPRLLHRRIQEAARAELAPRRGPHADHDPLRVFGVLAPREQPERGRGEHRDQHDARVAGDRRSARDPAVRGHQHPVRGVHPAVVLDPRLHPASRRHGAHGPPHGARLAAGRRGAALRWSMQIEYVKGKIMEGRRSGFPRQYGPERSDHQPGIPLFPQEATRDLVVTFILIAMMFFLSAFVTPFLGPARSPQISELIVPDWYLLFSWGLLKIADIFPQFTIGQGTPLKTEFSAAFWGDLLSGIPVIFLLILPFIDRGREARPAKAPVRSAFGLAFLIAWIFTSSLYSIREVVAQRWVSPNGAALIPDFTMKWFFVIPPVLVGLTSYIALRRLGFQPMRRWLVPYVAGLAAIVVAQSAWILFDPAGLGAEARPFTVEIAIALAIIAVPTVAAAAAVFLAPESTARKVSTWAGALGLLGFLAFYGGVAYLDQPVALGWVLSVLWPNMNTLVLVPMFAVVTAWLGTRRPYSTYEYLLNECYQCGKCHTVCPVTKVEDDALGGLNLVYNTFKKQHDGVPLWTCLACDACSAVCPLDIQYSDYILEERAKVHARMAADGGQRE